MSITHIDYSGSDPEFVQVDEHHVLKQTGNLPHVIAVKPNKGCYYLDTLRIWLAPMDGDISGRGMELIPYVDYAFTPHHRYLTKETGLEVMSYIVFLKRYDAVFITYNHIGEGVLDLALEEEILIKKSFPEQDIYNPNFWLNLKGLDNPIEALTPKADLPFSLTELLSRRMQDIAFAVGGTPRNEFNLTKNGIISEVVPCENGGGMLLIDINFDNIKPSELTMTGNINLKDSWGNTVKAYRSVQVSLNVSESSPLKAYLVLASAATFMADKRYYAHLSGTINIK